MPLASQPAGIGGIPVEGTQGLWPQKAKKINVNLTLKK